MLGIERLLGIINQSFEGPTTPSGFRPKGWEIPPKKSNIIMTRGEADRSHTIVRLPESMTSGGEKKA